MSDYNTVWCVKNVIGYQIYSRSRDENDRSLFGPQWHPWLSPMPDLGEAKAALSRAIYKYKTVLDWDWKLVEVREIDADEQI
jgi:hypothetical protein